MMLECCVTLQADVLDKAFVIGTESFCNSYNLSPSKAKVTSATVSRTTEPQVGLDRRVHSDVCDMT